MKTTTFLSFFFGFAASELLVSYDAAAGDAASKLGLLNLERARGDAQKVNSDDLYIKTATDPNGVPAAHVHRAEGLIRAEYHALKSKTQQDHTYYIGYQVSLGSIEDNLVLFQWYFTTPIQTFLLLDCFFFEMDTDTDTPKKRKAYQQNLASQNIPLDLEFDKNVLQFNHASPQNKRVPQWQKALETNVTYTFGLIVHAATGDEGWAQVYLDGKRQQMLDGTYSVNGSMWPGQSDPKFG